MMSITAEPLGSALGATLSGVDLRELDDAGLARLRELLLEYGVIFLRDQHISAQQQLDFCRRLGPIHLHPHVKGLAELPEVMEILKTETDLHNFGQGWHTDQMFLPEPAMATCLYGLEIPAAGGDTEFACMRTALRTLSPGLQRLARTLRTVNLPDAGRRLRGGVAAYSGFGGMPTSQGDATRQACEHPLVRTHPETGEDVLYIGLHTEYFAEFSVEESRPLIDYLVGHVTRAEHCVRFRWQPRSLALWDNRRVLHTAINDYQGQRRRMHRVTIAGDRPVLREAHPAAA